jgi:WD40 repeat protein
MFINTETYNIDYSDYSRRAIHLALSGDGTLLAFTPINQPNKSIEIMNTITHEIIGSMQGLQVGDIALSLDGQLIAAPSEFYADLRVWDVKTQKINHIYHTQPSGYYLKHVDISKSKTYLVSSSGDVILYKIYPETIIFEKTLNIESLIYPNPLKDSISLSFYLPRQDNVSINLYRITGELIINIKKQFYDSGQINETYYLGNLTNGSYLLKVESEGFNKTFKIIIDK